MCWQDPDLYTNRILLTDGVRILATLAYPVGKPWVVSSHAISASNPTLQHLIIWHVNKSVQIGNNTVEPAYNSHPKDMRDWLLKAGGHLILGLIVAEIDPSLIRDN